MIMLALFIKVPTM